MTVELVPNCNHCPEIGVANNTFFVMVNTSGMADIIGKQTANDPLIVSNEDSLLLLHKLKKWNPPEDWGGGFRPEKMKSLFVEFFRRCDGFTTH